MTKTNIIIAIIAIVLLGGGAWTYTNFVKYAPKTYITETEAQTVPDTEKQSGTDTTMENNGSSSTVTTVNTVTGETTPGSPTYTLEQIATHADANSCYTVINSIVYDLTMWVNMHPGGKSAILSLCGHDGTTTFMNQHHGAKKQMDILARFKIGLLVQ